MIGLHWFLVGRGRGRVRRGGDGDCRVVDGGGLGDGHVDGLGGEGGGRVRRRRRRRRRMGLPRAVGKRRVSQGLGGEVGRRRGGDKRGPVGGGGDVLGLGRRVIGQGRLGVVGRGALGDVVVGGRGVVQRRRGGAVGQRVAVGRRRRSGKEGEFGGCGKNN